MTTVLIVDDADNFRIGLRVMLSSMNREWDVLDAANAAMAIQIIGDRLARGPRVDIVLTDLFMPAYEDGLQVLSSAKALDPGIMTILFSGKIYELKDRKAAYELGAFDILDRLALEDKLADELNFKVHLALSFRDQQRQIGWLRRHIDARVVQAVMRDESKLMLTNRTVTICFWDLRGFSAMSDTFDSKPWVISNFLVEYFALASATIKKHDGILDKFLGDGVMGIFGFPLTNKTVVEDGAGDAAHAALELNSAFDTLADKWTPIFERETTMEINRPKLGCGINTAQVLVGYIGGEDRGDFTALGSGVNLAARVQDLARDCAIVLTRTTKVRIPQYATSPFNGGQAVNNIKNIPGSHVLFSLNEKQSVTD